MKYKLSSLKRRIGSSDFEVQIGRWAALSSASPSSPDGGRIPHVAEIEPNSSSLLGASTMFLLMMLGLTLSIRVQWASSEGEFGPFR